MTPKLRSASRNARGVATQHGMALAMSLIFLLILTLLAVVSMNTGSMQEKMAGNMRDLDIAMQSAESAMFPGRGDMNNHRIAGIPACQGNTNNIWCVGTTDWKTPSWWSSNGVEYGGGGKQIAEAYQDPRYAIEVLETPDSVMYCGPVEGLTSGRPCEWYHRIHARGLGATGVAESILHGVVQNPRTK